MGTFAILPVNRLSEAKSRLSTRLTAAERGKLVLCMSMDVLDALTGLPTVVVCPEDIRPYLGGYEFHFLIQRRGGLSSAVEAANRYAVELGAEATFFVPADVPLLSRGTVREILRLGKNHEVIISPSRRRGVGMLYRRPPEVMRALFSEKSFDDNLREASRKGIDVFVYESPELYADIDTPGDVRGFLELGRGTRSYELLKKFESRFKC